MSQHDYVIANGTGAAVRSDLNGALAAIVTQNSGATAPATTYAYQWWADTTTGLLKLRNAANNAWITLFQLDGEWSTLAVENGSASAPSIYFKDSGTDTGFYSPGADQVAVATNGTGRLFVNSSGSVGIGTSSPLAKLHVNNQVYVKGAASSDGEIGIDITSGGSAITTSSHRIRTAGGSGRLLYIETETVDSNGQIGFATNGSERLRIDSSGRVGIGTTAAPAKLTVSTSSFDPSAGFNNWTDSFFAVSPGGTSTSGGVGIAFDSSANVGSIVSALPSNSWRDLKYIAAGHRFEISGSEKARIDTSGRLLVGTSTSIESNALIQSYKASGEIILLNKSDSLGDGQSCRTENVSGGRNGNIGVYKHSGITNPAGYIYITEEDGGGAFYWTDNSGNFRISSNAGHIGTSSGTVVGTQTSDERLKNILGPVEYGLDALKQIEPVRYALKSEPDVEKLGFIAQQVQPLIPQSVFDTNEHIEGEPEDAPTKLGMEYVALIPVLVNAIKELSAEVDALKAQLS